MAFNLERIAKDRAQLQNNREMRKTVWTITKIGEVRCIDGPEGFVRDLPDRMGLLKRRSERVEFLRRTVDR
jgi:hypothetical protein